MSLNLSVQLIQIRWLIAKVRSLLYFHDTKMIFRLDKYTVTTLKGGQLFERSKLIMVDHLSTHPSIWELRKMRKMTTPKIKAI